MREEDKFDEIIRSKFSEKEFIFDEENWEKAEAMLDSARRRKSAVKWSAVFLLGLFAGVALMLPFVIRTDSFTPSNSFFSESSSEIQISPLTDEGIVENKNEISKEKMAIYNSGKNQKTVAEIFHPEVKTENPPKEDMLASNESKEKTVVEQNEKGTSDEEGIKTIIYQIHISETSPIQSPIMEQISLQHTETKNDSVSDKTISVNNLNQELLVQVPVKDSVKPKTDLLSEVFLPATQADSSAVALQNNSAETPPVAQSLASTTIFSVHAGTNYGMGWSYNDTTEAQGFNPVFGIGITHYFNQIWSLYSGVQYGNIAHLKASKKIFSSKTFDFGYNSVDTIVDTKSLYYVVIPIQFHYHYNNKNSIGMGGSVSYLVNTKSNVSIYTNHANTTQKREMGYYAGAFRQWDASLSVAYRRRISEKFGIAVSMNYGLIDIKDNSFFSREKFERNIGFTLMGRKSF